MVTNRIIKGISFEPEVFAALESLRGNKAHFRSGYINSLVREKLKLPEKAKK